MLGQDGLLRYLIKLKLACKINDMSSDYYLKILGKIIIENSHRC